MTFATDLAAFTAKLKARNQLVFFNTANAVKHSITEGSATTGAPGQPVDTGTLKASWHLSFESPAVAQISTNIAYAPVIEDNARSSYNPAGQQPTYPDAPAGGTNRKGPSTVGGHHSVRYTIAGFERLVAVEVRRAGGAA